MTLLEQHLWHSWPYIVSILLLLFVLSAARLPPPKNPRWRWLWALAVRLAFAAWDDWGFAVLKVPGAIVPRPPWEENPRWPDTALFVDIEHGSDQADGQTWPSALKSYEEAKRRGADLVLDRPPTKALGGQMLPSAAVLHDEANDFAFAYDVHPRGEEELTASPRVVARYPRDDHSHGEALIKVDQGRAEEDFP